MIRALLRCKERCVNSEQEKHSAGQSHRSKFAFESTRVPSPDLHLEVSGFVNIGHETGCPEFICRLRLSLLTKELI